jgi:hypothetical protein
MFYIYIYIYIYIYYNADDIQATIDTWLTDKDQVITQINTVLNVLHIYIYLFIYLFVILILMQMSRKEPRRIRKDVACKSCHTPWGQKALPESLMSGYVLSVFQVRLLIGYVLKFKYCRRQR